MKKFFCLLIALFSFINVVSASESVNVHAVFIDNPWYYQFKVFDDGTVMKARGSHLYAQNNLVYCIEPKILITEQTYYPAYNLLRDDIYKRVSLIGYYGFAYEDQIHEYYRVATQHLIWEYLEAVNDVYISSDDAGKNRIDISFYKNTILNLVNNHYVVPSFNGQKISGYLGEVIELVDNNHVLHDYKLMENYEGITKLDDRLIIEIGKVDIKNIKLVKEMPFRMKNEYYASGASQKLIRTGEVDPVYANLEIEILSGSVEINKIDKETNSNNNADGSLRGAIYGLYDDENQLIEELITDENGKAFVNNLPVGKYYVKELVPSPGYELDFQTYMFEISKDNLKQLIISYEELIKVVVPITYIEMPNTFIS